MSSRRKVTYSQRPNHAARSAHARGEREFRRYDTSYIRPKKSKGPVIFAIVLAVVVVGGLGWGAFTLFNTFSGAKTELLAQGEKVTIEVQSGSGAQAIGKQLQDARLVANASDFTKRVTALGMDSQLKPGTYVFEGGTSVDDLVTKIAAGPEATGGLTIPEGSTLAQTADLVAQATEGRVTADAFKAAASNASVYAAEFPFLAEVGTNSLEGFLFPKTYPVDEATTAESLVKAMLAQYQKEVSTLDYAYPTSQGLTAYDVLKLASVVEKESNAETRARVASVFYNRLASERPYLESDATTAYEVGRNPTAEDVATPGPYNTYKNAGLPPTPINSPGLDCLKAVCDPEQTDYMFFYFEPDANGVMQYYFSKTYDEHRATYE